MCIRDSYRILYVDLGLHFYTVIMASSSTKRKVPSIQEKVRVIRSYESGRKIADVCCEFGLVNSTVCTVRIPYL